MHSTRSMNHTPLGTRTEWNSSSVNPMNVMIVATTAPRKTLHMSRVETYRHQRS